MKQTQTVWRLRMGCGEALTAGLLRLPSLPVGQRHQRARPAFRASGGKP